MPLPAIPANKQYGRNKGANKLHVLAREEDVELAHRVAALAMFRGWRVSWSVGILQSLPWDASKDVLCSDSGMLRDTNMGVIVCQDAHLSLHCCKTWEAKIRSRYGWTEYLSPHTMQAEAVAVSTSLFEIPQWNMDRVKKWEAHWKRMLKA